MVIAMVIAMVITVIAMVIAMVITQVALGHLVFVTSLVRMDSPIVAGTFSPKILLNRHSGCGVA